ncbi:MAG: FadR/GntR family transcriptional regulator [Candidatus Limnocylindria bacterium]
MKERTKPQLDWPAMTVTASKLSDAVYSTLERLISSGQLPPGARLPSERDLAVSLGVSRNSVREAVHELELKRLVDRRAGRGTIVLDPEKGVDHRSLLGELSAEDRNLIEIMDFRLTIEPPMAGVAASRTTRRDLKRLEELLDQMEREDDPRQVAELDVAFHSAVARATQNPLLTRLHEVSSRWLRTSRRRALQSNRRRAASLAGHRRIYAALAARDADAARTAMIDHISQVRRIIDPRAARASGDDDG